MEIQISEILKNCNNEERDALIRVLEKLLMIVDDLDKGVIDNTSFIPISQSRQIIWVLRSLIFSYK